MLVSQDWETVQCTGETVGPNRENSHHLYIYRLLSLLSDLLLMTFLFNSTFSSGQLFYNFVHVNPDKPQTECPCKRVFSNEKFIYFHHHWFIVLAWHYYANSRPGARTWDKCFGFREKRHKWYNVCSSQACVISHRQVSSFFSQVFLSRNFF